MTITKANLINQVHASNPEMTKNEARTAVETVLSIMKSSLEKVRMFSCLVSGNSMLMINQPGKGEILKPVKV
jgi:hypothetical protein